MSCHIKALPVFVALLFALAGCGAADEPAPTSDERDDVVGGKGDFAGDSDTPSCVETSVPDVGSHAAVFQSNSKSHRYYYVTQSYRVTEAEGTYAEHTATTNWRYFSREDIAASDYYELILDIQRVVHDPSVEDAILKMDPEAVIYPLHVEMGEPELELIAPDAEYLEVESSVDHEAGSITAKASLDKQGFESLVTILASRAGIARLSVPSTFSCDDTSRTVHLQTSGASIEYKIDEIPIDFSTGDVIDAVESLMTYWSWHAEGGALYQEGTTPRYFTEGQHEVERLVTTLFDYDARETPAEEVRAVGEALEEHVEIARQQWIDAGGSEETFEDKFSSVVGVVESMTAFEPYIRVYELDSDAQ